ncbi:MAG: biotin/lipoyl-binding protein [Bdellovibrionales bacterium]|nr:biotin/lipoyl-binding protein [Bdellovibrionales bacterium]
MREVVSNMTGTVLRVLVKVGEQVQVDQDIVALESMKMEMMVPSTASGTVKEVRVNQDDFVQEGQVLLILG